MGSTDTGALLKGPGTELHIGKMKPLYVWSFA